MDVVKEIEPKPQRTYCNFHMVLEKKKTAYEFTKRNFPHFFLKTAPRIILLTMCWTCMDCMTLKTWSLNTEGKHYSGELIRWELNRVGKGISKEDWRGSRPFLFSTLHSVLLCIQLLSPSLLPLSYNSHILRAESEGKRQLNFLWLWNRKKFRATVSTIYLMQTLNAAVIHSSALPLSHILVSKNPLHSIPGINYFI